MYYCNDCGYEFCEPEIQFEMHGLTSPPYEKLSVCPACKSGSISEKIKTHCRCCGARLAKEDTEYCSNICREKGEKLRNKERNRRKLQKSSPINQILKQASEYNKNHHTNYSYGQFVTLILPKLKAEKKKCAKKKSNI